VDVVADPLIVSDLVAAKDPVASRRGRSAGPFRPGGWAVEPSMTSEGANGLGPAPEGDAGGHQGQ